MNETSLAASIDRAAKQKAVEIQNRIESAIRTVLNDKFRPKDAGEEWIGDDIKAMVHWYANSIGANDKPNKPQPTGNLVDACRAHIINTLIKGLPQIQELLTLSEQKPNNE